SPSEQVARPTAAPQPVPVATASPVPAPPNSSLPQPVDPFPPREPKPVKSFRKSEQKPSLRAPSSSAVADQKIPARRRSDEELNEIRRREALSNLAPKPNPQSLVAHLAIVIPAYLLVVASVITCFIYRLKIEIPASFLAIAVLIAIYVFFKKPLSRYHAAFIAVSAFLVILFGTFQYFPHLLNGT
ncbi:MAG: hypothetical protein HC845_12850, partial [Akkermansiaceae bacterium]|nr:hypothetical protein [Akkermansiaceae bacterium]